MTLTSCMAAELSVIYFDLLFDVHIFSLEVKSLGKQSADLVIDRNLFNYESYLYCQDLVDSYLIRSAKLVSDFMIGSLFYCRFSISYNHNLPFGVSN